MKIRKTFFAALLILLAAVTVSAYDGDFYGKWENVDSNTGGITAFVISPSGVPGMAVINAYGSCSPTDCDWGKEELVLYGASVIDKDYQFAAASYYTNFSRTIITLEFMDDGRIFLDYYTQFTDNSNRQNYHQYDIYEKKGQEGCPDLIVDKIGRPVWDSTNRVTRIKAVIQNIGNVSAGASVARLIDPSTLQKTGAPYNSIAAVPSLSPGASYTVEFTLPYWVFNPDASLEVTADYKGQVKECDENNNTTEYNAIG